MADLTWRDGNELVASTGGEKWVRDRIIAERKKRDWSQLDLAEALNKVGMPLHQTAISKIEAGSRSVKIDEAIGLAKAFEIPFGEIFLPDEATEQMKFVQLLDAGPGAAAQIEYSQREYDDSLSTLSFMIRSNPSVRALYDRYSARVDRDYEEDLADAQRSPDTWTVMFWGDLQGMLEKEEQREAEGTARAVDQFEQQTVQWETIREAEEKGLKDE